MSCKLSEKCDNVFACNILRPNVELLGCNFYKPKKPMTNEEWFASLTTEEKARFFDRICYSAWGDRTSRFRDMADYTDWVEWLKEKHE